MNDIRGHFAKITVLGGLLTFATGCAYLDNFMTSRRSHQASSVVQYLYPDKAEPVVTPAVPVLSLPLKVGVAFVPEETSVSGHRRLANPTFTEKDKVALMEEVSSHFKEYPFVKSIELIPTAYLTPKGSFANLDQLRTMFGVDVIALLSYDQVQFTEQGFLSLSYWTLVGAYVVQGERNDTHTMLDAAIYDIASRKLLFRSPGISHVKGSATPINLGEQLKGDSGAGFTEAAKNLVANLQAELEKFQERVKHAPPEEIKIVKKPGYVGGGGIGGGSLDVSAVLLLAGMAGYLLWAARTGQARAGGSRS